MRAIIQDQVSHKFIEGPMKSGKMDSKFREVTADKAAYHADLSQGYELDNDAQDADDPYYEANERYD